MPKNWPIARKGTKFVVKPAFNLEGGLPLLMIIRDLLKLAQTRKEVKKAIHEKKLLINGSLVKDDKQTVLLLDVVTIVPGIKHYKLILNKYGKFAIEETKEANSKISKIINKKTLNGKKTQLNLLDGRNYLSEIKCNTNDSVIVNFKTKKIDKCLSLKEKATVLVFAGKHAGATGTINKIEDKMAELKIGKEKANVLVKQLMVVE
jgi:small subunit ribosomal protein S4e